MEACLNFVNIADTSSEVDTDVKERSKVVYKLPDASKPVKPPALPHRGSLHY